MNITDIAREAGFTLPTAIRAELEAFAAAIKAAHLAELTQGVEMTEPVAWKYAQSPLNDDGTQTSPWVWRYSPIKPFESVIHKDVTLLVTLDQCQQAVAAAVARTKLECKK